MASEASSMHVTRLGVNDAELLSALASRTYFEHYPDLWVDGGASYVREAYAVTRLRAELAEPTVLYCSIRDEHDERPLPGAAVFAPGRHWARIRQRRDALDSRAWCGERLRDRVAARDGVPTHGACVLRASWVRGLRSRHARSAARAARPCGDVRHVETVVSANLAHAQLGSTNDGLWKRGRRRTPTLALRSDLWSFLSGSFV
jgi:hypothetical protein